MLEDEEVYTIVEDMVDWSGLMEKQKRRRIPVAIRKLLTVHAPTRGSLEKWKADFELKHRIKDRHEEPEQEVEGGDGEHDAELEQEVAGEEE